MPSAASTYKYGKDILKTIDLVTYESAARNLKVMEICETKLLEVLYNIYPLMFQKKIKEFCLQLHDMIGKVESKNVFLFVLIFIQSILSSSQSSP